MGIHYNFSYIYPLFLILLLRATQFSMLYMKKHYRSCTNELLINNYVSRYILMMLLSYFNLGDDIILQGIMSNNHFSLTLELDLHEYINTSFDGWKCESMVGLEYLIVFLWRKLKGSWSQGKRHSLCFFFWVKPPSPFSHFSLSLSLSLSHTHTHTHIYIYTHTHTLHV